LVGFLTLFHKDDRFYRAIALAGAALDADGNVNMRLGITLGDGITLTT
jgi:hypothetical protein